MTVGLLYTGNSLEILKSLPEKSIHCVVTSPPYFGLRSYSICSCRQGRVQHDSSTLVGSQAGTPSEFSGPDPDCEKCLGTGHISGTSHVWGGDEKCEHQWLQEVRKIQSGGAGTVSAKQTTNLGTQGAAQEPVETGYCLFCDAWLGSLGNEPTPELFIEHLVMIFREVKRVLRDDGTFWCNIGDSYGVSQVRQTFARHDGAVVQSSHKRNRRYERIKEKDLIGIPWLLAFALRDDGWYLRQDIIWSKLNPMPESVTDRCVKAHEYVFLLSKSREYYFDHIAIREPATEYAKGKRSVSLGDKSLSKGQATGAGIAASGNALKTVVPLNPMRNKRSVWTLSSVPYKGAHFATFPVSLIEPIVIAGTSEYGCCASCGTPYERIVEKEQLHMSGSGQSGNPPSGKNGPDMQGGGETGDTRNGPVAITTTVGWKKMCECSTDKTVPATVLDPFSGAATTGLVALRRGLNFIGIEQNSDYNLLAEKRLLDAGLDCIVI